MAEKGVGLARKKRWYDFLPSESVEFLEQTPGEIRKVIAALQAPPAPKPGEFDAYDPRPGRPVIALDSLSPESDLHAGSGWAYPSDSWGEYPDYSIPPGAPFDDTKRDMLRSRKMSGPVFSGIDPEGRPLRSLFIANEHKPMTYGQQKALASILVGKPFKMSDIGKATGIYDSVTNSMWLPTPKALREGGWPDSVIPNVAADTAAHEAGHALDIRATPTNPVISGWDITKRLFADSDADAIKAEFREYLRLKGKESDWHHGEDHGPEEWTAQAVSEYVNDTGDFKKLAPLTAAKMRKIFNEDPRLNWLITLARNGNSPYEEHVG